MIPYTVKKVGPYVVFVGSALAGDSSPVRMTTSKNGRSRATLVLSGVFEVINEHGDVSEFLDALTPRFSDDAYPHGTEVDITLRCKEAGDYLCVMHSSELGVSGPRVTVINLTHEPLLAGMSLPIIKDDLVVARVGDFTVGGKAKSGRQLMLVESDLTSIDAVTNLDLWVFRHVAI